MNQPTLFETPPAERPPISVASAIEFTVPAVPVAQPRARATSRNGHASMYTPTTVKRADGSRKAHPIVAFKATVRHALSEIYKGPPLDCSLRIELLFILPRRQGLIWKTKPMPRVPHTSTPDIDNLQKSVMDAMKGLAWRDDALVSEVIARKWIAAGDEQPRVEIKIEVLV